MKLVAVLGALVLAAGVEREDFRYARDVPSDATVPIVIEPDAAMLAHTRVGFGDLRVVDANGEQVPWRPYPVEAPTFDEPVQVLNSGRRDGAAVALLDLGPGRASHDRIVLQVPDRNFVGRAVVLGANRPEGPFTRLSATGIYDVRGARRARSTTAVFPTSIFRYLEVRATGVTRIESATISRGAEPPRSVERTPRRTNIRQSGRRTVVTLDLGYRNVPVDEVRISAGTKRYDRPIVVETSNDRFGRRWVFAAGGRISRFEGSLPGPIPVGVRTRYVRVKIENGDDPALAGIRVEATSRSHAVVLEGGHEAPYTLFYGAPGVRAPSYEFARIPLDPKKPVQEGVLAAERVNPAFAVPEEPFGERYRWLLQVALAAAALVVASAGFLALRRRA